MITDYLTEENLSVILTELFPAEKIERQYKFKSTKIDFGIIFKHNNLGLSDIFKLDTVVDNLILIEFDGHFHYTDTSQTVKDLYIGLGLSKWNKIDDCIYGLRIPYFVQLDKYTTKHMFGVDNVLNDYKHGFIDKKAVMPNRFCKYGERRFVKDLKNLPFVVGKEIFDSIINKYKHPKMIEMSMSYDVFDSLTKYFYKDIYDTVVNKKEQYNTLNTFERMLLMYKKRYEQLESWM